MTHTEKVMKVTGCTKEEVPELDDIIRESGLKVGEITKLAFSREYKTAYLVLDLRKSLA